MHTEYTIALAQLPMAAIEMEESHNQNTSSTDDTDSSSDSELHLSCSFPSFEGENEFPDSSESSHEDTDPEIIRPYSFEPVASGSVSLCDFSRLDKLMSSKTYGKYCFKYRDAIAGAGFILSMIVHRCRCGHCEIMVTGLECLCCCEIESVKVKMEESSSEIHCITNHEGFQRVCLVLQAAYRRRGFSSACAYCQNGKKPCA